MREVVQLSYTYKQLSAKNQPLALSFYGAASIIRTPLWGTDP